MRCKGCNKVLSNTELKMEDPNDGSFLDLCSRCGTGYLEALNIEAPKRDFRDYVHGEESANIVFVPSEG